MNESFFPFLKSEIAHRVYVEVWKKKHTQANKSAINHLKKKKKKAQKK